MKQVAVGFAVLVGTQKRKGIMRTEAEMRDAAAKLQETCDAASAEGALISAAIFTAIADVLLWAVGDAKGDDFSQALAMYQAAKPGEYMALDERIIDAKERVQAALR